MEAHQAALAAAAGELGRAGGVEYWTDFLKVRGQQHDSAYAMAGDSSKNTNTLECLQFGGRTFITVQRQRGMATLTRQGR